MFNSTIKVYTLIKKSRRKYYQSIFVVTEKCNVFKYAICGNTGTYNVQNDGNMISYAPLVSTVCIQTARIHTRSISRLSGLKEIDIAVSHVLLTETWSKQDGELIQVTNCTL